MQLASLHWLSVFTQERRLDWLCVCLDTGEKTWLTMYLSSHRREGLIDCLHQLIEHIQNDWQTMRGGPHSMEHSFEPFYSLLLPVLMLWFVFCSGGASGWGFRRDYCWTVLCWRLWINLLWGLAQGDKCVCCEGWLRGLGAFWSIVHWHTLVFASLSVR